MNRHECRDCGHIFTDGYFDANAASILFAKRQPNQTVGRDMERQRPVSARVVARVARLMPEGRWLDVGFGNGSLLFTAEEWGFTPAGLDLREANVRALNQLGYEAHCLPIEALDHNARYSVISMAPSSGVRGGKHVGMNLPDKKAVYTAASEESKTAAFPAALQGAYVPVSRAFCEVEQKACKLVTNLSPYA